jgi:hypothetical protein
MIAKKNFGIFLSMDNTIIADCPFPVPGSYWLKKEGEDSKIYLVLNITKEAKKTPKDRDVNIIHFRDAESDKKRIYEFPLKTFVEMFAHLERQ